MNQIYDYINQFNYEHTATLIHVASDAIREEISFAKAYENLGALIHPIHNAKGVGMFPLIEDIQDPRQLNNLIIIGAMRLQNLMKAIYS
ncbi:hypothetical protein HW132_30850 [Brasilonema sp. CT11]|nr:hypothetical protein [Brasilonema sp. CT11]